MRIPFVLAVLVASAACQNDPSQKQIAALSEQAPPNPCHDFRTPVTAAGRPEQASGQACPQPDGSWQVVQNTPGLPAQTYVVPPPGQPAAASSFPAPPPANRPTCSSYSAP